MTGKGLVSDMGYCHPYASGELAHDNKMRRLFDSYATETHFSERRLGPRALVALSFHDIREKEDFRFRYLVWDL